MVHPYQILPVRGNPPGPPNDYGLAVGQVNEDAYVFYDETGPLRSALTIRSDRVLDLEKCR